MLTWRPLLAILVTSLLVGLAGARPVHAVVSIAAAGSTVVPYSGTVDGPPESVYLSGTATISYTVVRDPDFGSTPRVLLYVDLAGITGVGLTSGRAYVTSGSQRLIRLLVPVDQVDVTFAIYPRGAGGALAARAALASFTLSYDVGTGALATGTASADVNVVTSPAE